MKSTQGGKRAGAGAKKGSKWPATLEKEAARELTRQLITEHIRDLLSAAVANAKGLQYLVTRDKKSGKFVKVGEAMARSSDAETIEIWEKEPSVEALKVLLDRALDKPKEQAQEHRIEVVDAAAILRQRHDKHRQKDGSSGS